MTMRTATRDGTKLAYLDTGVGDPPFVFVHGWSCNHSHFALQVEHFAIDHRVVAVDLRGHGASDAPDQRYTVSAFADDVAWLCEAAGVERPVLVGHSMGGQVVLDVAARYPDLAHRGGDGRRRADRGRVPRGWRWPPRSARAWAGPTVRRRAQQSSTMPSSRSREPGAAGAGARRHAAHAPPRRGVVRDAHGGVGRRGRGARLHRPGAAHRCRGPDQRRRRRCAP